jgi:hypothetical protein
VVRALIFCLTLAVAVSSALGWAQSVDPGQCAGGGCSAAAQTARRFGRALDPLPGDALSFKNNWFLTGDYTVGGIGLRGAGVNGVATGTINIAGVPANADIIAAYVYWETLGNGQNGTFLPQGASQTSNIAGTALGTVASPCWPTITTITVYRADVLQYFPRDNNGRQLVNGGHRLTLPDSGNPSVAPSTEGASLVIVWRLPGLSYKAIILYDGAFTITGKGNVFNQTILGFYQASSVNPQARMTHIVGDGQAPSPFPNNVNINGTIYNNPFTGAQGAYWDNFTVPVTVAGNASQVTTSSTLVNDCLTWGAVVFSTTVQDTDGDGIPDAVEISGMTDPADGTFVNFPAMGANPNVKDIFIQLDWMVAADHNHQPKQAALNKVIAGFAAAPGGAVNVHFDVGQGGAFTGGGHAIPEVTPTAWKKDFNVFKASNFANNRRNFWRYGLFAHSQPGTTSSGISDLPGGDFMVTFGGWTHPAPADNMVGTEDEQAGTIMHEAGHGFNLKHGGADHTPNCKPNFESVMNYSFQVTGLMDAAGTIHWDYSRQTMADLNESALSESAGLGNMSYRTRWFAPANPIDQILGNTRMFGCTAASAIPFVRKDSTSTGAPLNWNNNLTFSPLAPFFVPNIEPGIIPAVDVNGSLTFDAIAHSGYNDWANIDFLQTNGRVNQANGELANGELANGELGNGELANGELANGSDPEIQFEVASKQTPPAPVGLAARVARGQIRLAWNPVQLKIIAGYNIYRFDPANPAGTLTSIPYAQTSGSPPPASFTDTQVVPGTRYGYFVTAVDSFIPSNQSSYSNVIAVTAQ